MTHHTHLLIIDPQNDFCDLPGAALPVAGADADMQRLAAFIRTHGAALTDITLTLDSHHRIDIAHPTFWQQADGSAVAPFTTITAAEVHAGQFVPRQPGALGRTLAYLDALEARSRYLLMVWPVHCEIGTWGHNVHAGVRAAYNTWEDQQGRNATKLTKGSHSNKASTAVTTLNSKCANASRWPLRSLPSIPTNAVEILLPTLEPMAIANACSTPICPPAKAAKVKINVAWVDCNTMVSNRPMPQNTATSAAPLMLMAAKSTPEPIS